ncbi:MAG: CapA family protein [Crocinitomicaceae bacterium]|nr:CapA family protein [Crocinitomicaceae bacterium]
MCNSKGNVIKLKGLGRFGVRASCFLLFVFLMNSCQQEQHRDDSVSEKSNESESQEIKSSNKLTILFAGDLLLDRGVRKQVERKGFDHLFSGVDSLIQQHSYFIVNLETPLTEIKSPLNKKYIFRSDPEHAKGLKSHGVTHAILSNNHSMDQSKDGLEDTKNHLTRAGIQSIGYGENVRSFCSPTLIQNEKDTVALFGSVQIPVENWFQVDDQPGICQMQGEELENYIQNYHQLHPNYLIIVNLHWGLEYLSAPNFTQIQHAKNLIDAGAELIVGHHPHVIQSTQEYNGKMIYYSIGNFIFDSTHPNSKKAFLISVEIDETGKLISKPIKIQIENCRPELVHPN